jgi:hypothetical protein
MSDGKKAWAEDLEMEAEVEATAKFAKLKPTFVRAKINTAFKRLEWLKNDEKLSLTQSQWHQLYDAIAQLEELR